MRGKQGREKVLDFTGLRETQIRSTRRNPKSKLIPCGRISETRACTRGHSRGRQGRLRADPAVLAWTCEAPPLAATACESNDFRRVDSEKYSRKHGLEMRASSKLPITADAGAKVRFYLCCRLTVSMINSFLKKCLLNEEMKD